MAPKTSVRGHGRDEATSALRGTVDAELAAILLALREVVKGTEAAQRRCLIMSDSASAIKLVERAWRAPGRGSYALGSRGHMLEAINTYRERIQMLVLVYVPAHRGFAANSYADAIAKASTSGAISF